MIKERPYNFHPDRQIHNVHHAGMRGDQLNLHMLIHFSLSYKNLAVGCKLTQRKNSPKTQYLPVRRFSPHFLPPSNIQTNPLKGGFHQGWRAANQRHRDYADR